MKPLLLFATAVVISVCTFLIAGCNKSERDEDTETLSARDYALAHHIFDDAFRQVHKFAMGDTLLNDTNIKQQKLDACLSRRGTFLSDTVAVFPMYLQLNYADAGKQCNDSAVRYGIIRADFSGKYLNKGTIVSISFEGYRNDIYDVEDGTVTFVNKGVNSDGRRYYIMTIEDALITGPNIHINLDGVYTYIWVAGSSTEIDFTDDVFEISEGLASGTNSRGSTFTNEITEPYVSDFSCPHFTSGRSVMEVQNLTPRSLNYGDVTVCDNILISRRNNTYMEVEIPIMQPGAF